MPKKKRRAKRPADDDSPLKNSRFGADEIDAFDEDETATPFDTLPSFRKLPSAEGQIVTKKGLQKLLGWHQNTLEAWIDRGLPCRVRGSEKRDYQISTADAIHWIMREIQEVTMRLYSGDDAVDESMLRRLHPDDPRHRKEILHADKLELELSKEYKDVISIRDAMVILAEQFGVVKSQLTALPGRVMMQLSRMDDPREIEKLLKAELFQSLEAMNVEDVAKADDPLQIGADEEDEEEKL